MEFDVIIRLITLEVCWAAKQTLRIHIVALRINTSLLIIIATQNNSTQTYIVFFHDNFYLSIHYSRASLVLIYNIYVYFVAEKAKKSVVLFTIYTLAVYQRK